MATKKQSTPQGESEFSFVEEIEISGHIIDSLILPKVLDAAERFEHRPSDQEMHYLAEHWQMEPMFV